MTKVRRRGSRTDLASSTPTKRLPAVQVPVGAHPTLSVAIVGKDDVPTLLSEPPHADEQVGLLKLVSTIDGKATISELAERCRLDVEQARALVAQLQSKGFVTVKARTESEPVSEPKGQDYWLAGLKPRTK